MGFRCDKWETRHVAINPKHPPVGASGSEAPLLRSLMSTCNPNCLSKAL